MQQLEVFHAIFPENLRDRIVDALLLDEELSGFSLVSIDGHSRNNSRFDRLEQVVGYRRMVRLEVLVTEQDKQRVIDILQKSSMHSQESAGIRYYVTPVLESGHL